MKMLFVSGCIRSGTTLLNRGLDAHPEITCANDALFPAFKRAYTKHREEENLDPNAPLSDRFNVPAWEKEAFKERIFDIPFDQSDIKEIRSRLREYNDDPERNPRISEHLRGLSPGPFREVLRELYQAIHEAYGSEETVVVGSQQHWCEQFIIPFLESFSEETYAVNIVRDPRAVFTSRNFGSYLEEMSGVRHALLFLVRNWRKSVSYNVLNEDRDEFVGITYRQLVSHPGETYRDICDVFGISYDDRMTDVSTYTDGFGKPWTTNTSFEAQEGISTKSLERWKEKLPEEVSLLLEWLCEPELWYLDFEIPDRELSMIDAASRYTEDLSRIRDYQLEYGYTWDAENLEVEAARRHLWRNVNPTTCAHLSARLFGDVSVHEAYKDKLAGVGPGGE